MHFSSEHDRSDYIAVAMIAQRKAAGAGKTAGCRRTRGPWQLKDPEEKPTYTAERSEMLREAADDLQKTVGLSVGQATAMLRPKGL